MSDTNYYQPHILIDGRPITEGRGSREGERALAKIEIKWGGDDWFSNIDPATCKIVIRDQRPTWSADLANRLAPVMITRDPDQSVVFRGRIVDAETRRVETTNKRGGESIAYEHTLTANDPLGTMARDRRRGPLYPAREGEDHVAHWGPCRMSERKADLQARTVTPLVFEPNNLDQYDSESTFIIWPITPYQRNQTVSALTVLRNTMRIERPLARPYYHPGRDEIRGIEPSRNAARGLSVEAFPGYAYLWKDTGVDELIPGDNISMPDGVETSTSAVEQVTNIELLLRVCRPNQVVTSANSSSGTRQVLEWVDSAESFRFARDADSQMTVSLDCDHSAGFWYWPIHYGIRISDQVAGLYGLPRLAPLRYQFPKDRAAPAWAVPFLTPHPPTPTPENLSTPTRYRLYVSQTNEWPGFPAFSIVGGTLSYTTRKGWVADMNPTAVGVDVDESPTLGDLAQSKVAGFPIWAIADSSLVADWQQVTSLS